MEDAFALVDTQAADEIAQLLDQCSPDELNSILMAIQGGQSQALDGDGQKTDNDVLSPASAADPATTPKVVETAENTIVPPSTERSGFAPVPPAAPPPGSAGRRPVPAGVKRTEASQEGQHQITVDEVKALLESHSNMVLSEVRKLMPGQDQGYAQVPMPPESAPQVDGVMQAMETVDMDTLTRILVDRDRSVKELEMKLAGLQTELAEKDQRVAQLGGELDIAVREVRHKQLDLEFQQLKLEERVRSNAELEHAQRILTARAGEASLNARHAAIDLEMCQSTPRSVRVQGSLPWTLRKNKITGGP